jgi:hypothetical protein
MIDLPERLSLHGHLEVLLLAPVGAPCAGSRSSRTLTTNSMREPSMNATRTYRDPESFYHQVKLVKKP